MIIFSGNSSKDLASKIATILDIELGDAKIAKFADGEINIKINQNVRGHEVYIIQSTSFPVNDNVMELTILADALRRASVKSITAIIPYYGYSRQDRRVNSARVPISARLVADFIRCSGIKRILTIDLHSEQIQGFFDIPVDNVYASNIMVEDIKKTQKNIDDIIVVSPDIGGVQRARAVAKQIDAELAIIDKRRPMENKAEVMHVIGEVKNKVCLIVDDIIDTGGTLIQAAKSLKERGSKKVVAYITHPILSKDAAKNINDSEYLDELVVTDTISLSKECDGFKSIRQITSATLLAECILRINSKKSISEIM